MIVVSDSTPLIHLAKVGYMKILFFLYSEILITGEVYKEVVEEGKALKKDDAVVVKEYVDKGIKVKNPMLSSKSLIEKYHIHKGEADSIQLAKETGAELVLINEREGRIAAKCEGFKVKGTIGVLFDALKIGAISKTELSTVLSRFKEFPQVFWIEPDIIKAAMEKLH